MQTADFSYDLPEELIAQTPPEVRGTSRMMVIDRAGSGVEHRTVSDIVDYLRPGDLLILNNTRVFPARILGAWEDTAGAAELLLLHCEAQEVKDDSGYRSTWMCMCGSGRKARAGHTILCAEGHLRAAVQDKNEEGHSRVCFTSERPLMDLLEEHGRVPVPPYIRRDGDNPDLAKLDRERYQTIYAREVGAVAAPTAGLHFTDEIFQALEAKGVRRAFVTLHVGPGTFKPVKAERVEDHRMDAESYTVSEETARAIRETRAAGGRIIAVGSTSVRTLETVAALHNGEVVATHGWSTAFIYPPYTFRAIDALLTNFHLPQSTLIMMVSALAGRDRILAAYEEAVKQRYRFFSYGDCMFIHQKTNKPKTEERMDLYVVILAGGRGERLWPLSTAAHPKPLLRIGKGASRGAGEKPILRVEQEADVSLLRQTCLRVKERVPAKRICLVATQDLIEILKPELSELPKENFIVEPTAAGTAAAVALACGVLKERRNGKDCQVLILSADLRIDPPENFNEVLSDLSNYLCSHPETLALFGNHPTGPATGYGYMWTEFLKGEKTVLRVKKYIEKPKKEDAEKYCTQPGVLWNSGIFLAALSHWEALFRKHAAAYAPMFTCPKEAKNAYDQLKEKKTAVDVAVVEKAEEVVVAQATYKWDDLGTFESLATYFGQDEAGNRLQGRVTALNSETNIVCSTDPDHTVALLGVNNLAVIRTPKATLVVAREALNNLRDLYNLLPPDAK